MAVSRVSIGLAAAAAASAFVLRPADAQVLPADVQPSCMFRPADFAAMFVSGTVTVNGAVMPANSTVNPGASNQDCPFFLWADQMYLWLTSPVPGAAPGPAGPVRTMFSSAFYTVAPEDSAGRRSFVRNVANAPVPMGLRTAKPPTMLPLLRARTGQLVQVLPAAAGAPAAPSVRLRSGASARLASVRRSPSGTLRFFDARGRELQVRRPSLPRLRQPAVVMPGGERLPVAAAAGGNAVQVRRFTVGGIPVFLDAANNVVDVDVEEGQAGGGGVLVAQNLASPSQPAQASQLVYYMIAVNDVFAYHRTMQGQAVITDPTTITFPQNQADVNAVAAYAQGQGLPPLADPQALAIETKSSWIEASNVPNPEDYIQIQASLPVFDTSDPNQWVLQAGRTRTATMVMVGLHVVGSTQGHGEMVWASFEHFGNAPNAAYSYTNAAGQTARVAQDTSGGWLFTQNGAPGPFNGEPAHWRAPNIVGLPAPSPVAAATVLRTAPWGTLDAAASLPVNTSILSVNVSRIGQLLPGDLRRNYFQLGAVWTNGGLPPQPQAQPANLVGSTQLANATLETFHQGTTAATNLSCFSCHQSSTTLPASVAMSHVYGILQPLPPPFRPAPRRR